MWCHPPVGNKPGKGAQVEAMFNALAPRYDLLNRLLSLGIDRRWRRVAVDALGVAAPEQVLDVATGTGDLALEVLRLGPQRVVGMDISKEMLARARAKAQRKEATGRVTFVQGDAEDMPFQDAAFDVAMVAFGVRNFQDTDRGLNELYRVLRPGGRLVVLEFSQPRYRLIRFFYGIYGRFVLPAVGRIVSRVHGPYRYLPSSIRAFPHGEGFLARIRAAGFVDTEVRRLTFGVVSVYLGRTPPKDGT